ncbi:MAG: segregation/condensation protein A [Haloferacaceae archaeon]
MTDPLEDGIPGLGEPAAPDVDEGVSTEALLAERGTTEGDDASDGAGDGPTVEATAGDRDADDGPGSEDDEVEPVEVLVSLAKSGEIDPWDIDIVEVTDAFLDHLDRSDLRTSGRALFYASVLLRMKSDELLAPDEEEPDDPEPWEAAMEGGAPEETVPGFDPVDALEDEMERRLERKSTRGSPETLDELVRELREAERGSWWKESREYDTSGSPSGFSRGTQTLDYRTGDDFRMDGEPGEDDVTGTTHDEDIESQIRDVNETLRTHYDAGREEVLFAEVREAGGTTVTTYLALLFLANRGEVHLQQDELFGDLWIQDPTAARAADEAIAD